MSIYSNRNPTTKNGYTIMDSKTQASQQYQKPSNFNESHPKVVDLDALQDQNRVKESRSKRNRKGKGRGSRAKDMKLSLIHISEPTRPY